MVVYIKGLSAFEKYYGGRVDWIFRTWVDSCKNNVPLAVEKVRKCGWSRDLLCHGGCQAGEGRLMQVSWREHLMFKT